MSVLFGIEIIKPSESQAFKDLKKEFKEFKEKEEREDPEQERQIADIERNLNKLEGTVSDVESMNMKNVQDLRRRIKNQKLDIDLINIELKNNSILPLKTAVKGHTQKLEEIETTLKKNNIKEAMKAAVTKQQLEEAMKAAATKQQQEIQAFKKEMEKEFELKSLQLQLKNAQINKKGNSILDAQKNVYKRKKDKK